MKRRDFLRAGGGAILSAPFVFSSNKLFAQTTSRIIITKHSKAATSSGSPLNMVPDRAIINSMVDKMILLLTEKATVAEGWESLFPAGALSTTTKVAIKVNHSYDFYGSYNAFLNYDRRKPISSQVPNPPRMCPWGQKAAISEAIIDGLTQMLGGTFPIENITVYDKQVDALGTSNDYAYSASMGMVNQGYPPSTAGDAWTKPYSVSGPGSYNATLVNYRDSTIMAGMPSFMAGTSLQIPQKVFPPHKNSDFWINIGIPKDHSMAGYTGALKNCFGSTDNCAGAHSTGEFPNLIHECLPDFYTQLSAISPCILNVLDALAGVYDGGPVSGVPFFPNVIAGSTDPLAVECYGLELVNQARNTAGYHDIGILLGENADGHANAYFLALAQDPAKYNLGIFHAGNRSTADLETGTVGIAPVASLDSPHGRINHLLRSGAGWRLSVALDRSGRTHQIESTIFDTHGRVVRSLPGMRTPLSSADLWWDGKNGRGVTVTPGVYTWQVRINGRAWHQSLFVS